MEKNDTNAKRAEHIAVCLELMNSYDLGNVAILPAVAKLIELCHGKEIQTDERTKSQARKARKSMLDYVALLAKGKTAQPLARGLVTVWVDGIMACNSVIEGDVFLANPDDVGEKSTLASFMKGISDLGGTDVYTLKSLNDLLAHIVLAPRAYIYKRSHVEQVREAATKLKKALVKYNKRLSEYSEENLKHYNIDRDQVKEATDPLIEYCETMSKWEIDIIPELPQITPTKSKGDKEEPSRFGKLGTVQIHELINNMQIEDRGDPMGDIQDQHDQQSLEQDIKTTVDYFEHQLN